MTWIKICGITNLEDALTAVDAGADALGFVFYEKSPRRVEPERVREIVASLPATIEKVGVLAEGSLKHSICALADEVAAQRSADAFGEQSRLRAWLTWSTRTAQPD